MYSNSKKVSLYILGITAIACSRTMLVSFDDPEGPNLLIVMVMALIVYVASLPIFVFTSSRSTLKKLLLAILMQIVLVTGLFFFLR